MNEFDAAIDWLVQSGRAKSKGKARRKLIEQAAAPSEFGIAKGLPGMSSWMEKLVGGIAGASPAIPSIANRDIEFAGQNAGAGIVGILEVTKKRSPWQRFLNLFRRKWVPVRQGRPVAP